MSRKKKKRGTMDELLSGSLFSDTEELLTKFEKGEVSSGYSVSVTQTPEGTKVHAKVGKNTDVNALRQKLQQQYPNAQIEIEGGKPLIREISTKALQEEEQENKSDD